MDDAQKGRRFSGGRRDLLTRSLAVPNEIVQERFQAKPKCKIAEENGNPGAPGAATGHDIKVYQAFGLVVIIPPR
jgi:hypothetical protein